MSAPAPIPLDWLPAVSMARIIFHWTAGRHTANAAERRAYHVLVEGDGRVIKGASIAANARAGLPGVASHTRNLNTGSIGVAMCCMIGATERPFNPGAFPMTRVQWDRTAEVIAQLCRRYLIPATPRAVLSHAEVQGTLGIAQRAKWDVMRLAFDPAVSGAKACGDLMRAQVARIGRA